MLMTLWDGPSQQTHFSAQVTLLVLAFLQSSWLGLLLWLFCRAMPRLAPAVRTGLWWGACVQMLVVWSVAATRLHSGALPHWLPPLWFGGVTLRLLLLAVQWRQAGWLLHSSVAAPDCPAADALTALAARLALRRLPTTRLSPLLKTPALVGLRRPVLLMPALALQTDVGPELRMALAHELAHLRRRDLWYGLGPVLAQTMLFFHPCVRLAVREYVSAREEACDALARHVTKMTPDEYGAMLLEAVASSVRSAHRSRSFNPHYHVLLRRLNAMRIPYKQPHQGPLGAICSVLLLGAVGFSAFEMSGPLRAPTQAAPAPPETAAQYRVGSTQQSLPQRVQPAPGQADLHRDSSAPPAHRLHMAHAVTSMRVRIKASRAASALMMAALPKRDSAHSVVRKPYADAAVALVVPLTGKAVPVPHPMQVAWDTPSAHDSPSETFPDLSQMHSSLQALRQQMQQQQRQLQQTLPLTSLPDEGMTKQLREQMQAVREQMQAEFGPQFQRQWKQQDDQLRERLDADLPAIRAEVDQARREAAQAQVQARLSRGVEAQARQQALKESAQARQQALKESAQARREAIKDAGLARQQALRELEKEFPRMQDEIEKGLQKPFPPAPAHSPNDPAF